MKTWRREGGRGEGGRGEGGRRRGREERGREGREGGRGEGGIILLFSIQYLYHLQVVPCRFSFICLVFVAVFLV